MTTIDEVKEETRAKYGVEINFDEIVDNLSLDIRNSMNFVFCYGNPDNYHPNQDEIETDMESLIPEIILFYLDDKEKLLDIQNSYTITRNEDDEMSRDEYLDLLSKTQLSIVKQTLLILRMFETIKEVKKDDYPDWIDWWHDCFNVDIDTRYRQNQLAHESLFTNNIDSSLLVSVIIEYLIGRALLVLLEAIKFKQMKKEKMMPLLKQYEEI